MSAIVIKPSSIPHRVELPGYGPWDSQSFLAFCEQNRDLVAELDAEGNLIIMTPSPADAEGRVVDILAQVFTWTKETGFGRVFGSSAGFTLPNGSVRSPDVSVVKAADWEALTQEQRRSFPPLCPWFVLELRSSPSDSAAELQRKMAQYMSNGAGLGWLVDPIEGTLTSFRPNVPPETHVRPDAMPCDPELPGLVVDLCRTWD